MIKNNFAIRVSSNFIHVFEYKLHKYAPKTLCHLRFAALPPYTSLRRFVCGDKNLKKQIVFVVESSQVGWRWLKTPGNLRRVQHPVGTISHQFIYKWPMNKNDRTNKWRHSRMCWYICRSASWGRAFQLPNPRPLSIIDSHEQTCTVFPKTFPNEHWLLWN